jgi:hypothetical protein
LKNAQNSHLLAALFENETRYAAFQRRLQAGTLALQSFVELTLDLICGYAGGQISMKLTFGITNNRLFAIRSQLSVIPK